ncbi:MAG: ABC transporter permease subunit [Coriobacteriales bacterium]
MSLTLFAKELRANALPTLIVSAVLALYVVCIAYMYDPEIAKSLDELMDIMPELYAAFGMANATDSMLDFLLNYLYGFLFTLMPLLIIMMAVNRSLVRPVERGSMAYTLAAPVGRAGVALSLAAALLATMALVLAAVTLLQIGAAELFFPGELDVAGLLRATAGLGALWVFMSGLCFASAAALPNPRAALWTGGGLCLGMYLVQMLSQLGGALEDLGSFNPLQLYDCYALAAGGSAAGDAVTGAVALALAGLALFALGTAAFTRRDLKL